MKQLLDFLPLIVFFIFYKFYDIFVATGMLIAATTIVLALQWVLYRKIEKMTLVTFTLVVTFGLLTIIFHNDQFLKWKVTILYTLFSAALLFSQFVLGKLPIKAMLGGELKLPDSIWKRLNITWALFFIICALANIYVAFCFSLEIWVNFKVFGLTGVTLIFALLSGIYIYRHIPQDDE